MCVLRKQTQRHTSITRPNTGSISITWHRRRRLGPVVVVVVASVVVVVDVVAVVGLLSWLFVFLSP